MNRYYYCSYGKEYIDSPKEEYCEAWKARTCKACIHLGMPPGRVRVSNRDHCCSIKFPGKQDALDCKYWEELGDLERTRKNWEELYKGGKNETN